MAVRTVVGYAKHIRNTSTFLNATTKIIPNGVMLIESDTGYAKIGTGALTYADLPFFKQETLTAPQKSLITNAGNANGVVVHDANGKVSAGKLTDATIASTTPSSTDRVLMFNAANQPILSPYVTKLYYPSNSDETAVINAVLVIYPAANIVLDYSWPVGHARRYGINANYGINHELTRAAYTQIFLRVAALRSIVGVLPAGEYNTSLNIVGTTMSGLKMYCEGTVDFTGILHFLGSDNIQVGNPVAYDFLWDGHIRIYDRLGVSQAGGIRFNGRVDLLNNPAKNSATPGVGGRGIHITVEADDIIFNEVNVYNCVSTNNTDAAYNIDGGGGNPKNVHCKLLRIYNSQTHGIYLTGKNHRIDKLELYGYGADAYQGTGMQDINDTVNLDRSKELTGLFINRATGCSIGKTYIDQINTSAPNAKYAIRVMETGISKAESFSFGEVIVKNLGNGGAERGIALGDRNYASLTENVNVSADRFEVWIAEGKTLETGYQAFQVNRTGPGTLFNTNVSVANGIEFYNPNVETGVYQESYTTFTCGGEGIVYRSEPSKNARGTAADLRGFCQVSSVSHYAAGSSLTTAPAVAWRAMSGSKLGKAFGFAASATTKTFLLIDAATNTEIGGTAAENYRNSTNGVIEIKNTSDLTLKVDKLVTNGAIVTGSSGIAFTGACTRNNIYDGNISNFDVGLKKNTGATLSKINFFNTTIGIVTVVNDIPTYNNFDLSVDDVREHGDCVNTNLKKKISYGPTVPSNSIGDDGDIFVVVT